MTGMSKDIAQGSAIGAHLEISADMASRVRSPAYQRLTFFGRRIGSQREPESVARGKFVTPQCGGRTPPRVLVRKALRPQGGREKPKRERRTLLRQLLALPFGAPSVLPVFPGPHAIRLDGWRLPRATDFGSFGAKAA